MRFFNVVVRAKSPHRNVKNREIPAAPSGRYLHFTQILFENVTHEKFHNPSYGRRSP